MLAILLSAAMMKQPEEEWRQSVKLNGTDTCYGSTRTDTPNKLNRFVSVLHTAGRCTCRPAVTLQYNSFPTALRTLFGTTLIAELRLTEIIRMSQVCP